MAKNTKNENTEETPKVVTLATVAAKAAELSGKDPQKCGKEIRARIRRNFDDFVEGGWDALGEAKTNADGNRYPPMPLATAQSLLAPFRSKVTDEVDEDEVDEDVEDEVEDDE